MSSANLRGLPLILLGAGGHARVLLALAQAANRDIIGVCDPQLIGEGRARWRGIAVLGGDDAVEQHDPSQVGLINGIGQLVGGSSRQRIYAAMRQRGYDFPPLIHPAAWVADDVRLCSGAQIMAGAIIQPGCTIGNNAIVNTRATVDHDCVVGEHVHIAPGAILCGGVRVHPRAFIGAGAVVLQSLTVGADAVVGAGTTLIRNLPAGHTRIGAASRLKTT